MFSTFYFLLSTSYFSYAENTCITCHRGYEGRLGDPVKQWEVSIHKEKGITCEKCHGGDAASVEQSMSPAKGFIGIPKTLEIPKLCAKCHSHESYMRQFNQRTDQFDLYKTSQHGKLLFEKKDSKVATCVSCHGTHDIRSKTHPQSSVYRTNIPHTCAKCHSNAQYMKKYNLPTDQFEQYKQSYHGKLLLEKNDSRPANCADCHGVHGAMPPGVNEIANVCGNCHGMTEGYYNESGHKKAVTEVGVPRCIDCHGNHKIEYPNEEMFTGDARGRCGSCHDVSSSEYDRAQKFNNLINEYKKEIEETNLKLEELKKTGIDLSLLEEKINEAKAKVVEAIPITHTLSLERVRTKIKEANIFLEEIKSEIKKTAREARIRKIALIIVVLITLFIVFLLYLKIRSLNNK